MDTFYLPTINLPSHFTKLLKKDMRTSGEGFKNLSMDIYREPSLNFIFQRYFKDVDKDLRVDQVIKSLGWYGIRNRFASAYLDYQFRGKFPEKVSPILADDLVNFEERIKKITINGFSRAYMLAFYKKMAFIHLKKEGLTNVVVPDFTNEVFELLGLAQNKVRKVDWAFLYILHCNSYFGFEESKKLIEKRVSFRDIQAQMGQEKRRVLYTNLLSYGASIGDMEIFYTYKV